MGKIREEGSLSDKSTLQGDLSDRVHDLPKKISRYDAAKLRAKSNIQYLNSGVDFTIDEVGLLKRKLEDCGNWLLFRNYYTLGQTKLIKARFCLKHLMCPLCAIRRAAKSLQAYLERFEVIRAENPRLVPYLLTLTVTNGEDLQERFDHLVSSWKKYQDRRRQFFKRSRGFNELCKVKGAVFSYEFTKSDKGWHPHLHALIMVDPDELIDFDQFASGKVKAESKLSKEWLNITGDSSIVDCRPIDTDNVVKSFCEVFKYALKFSDLTPADNYQAYKILNKKRLQGSFGLFWGVKVPEKLTDETLGDDLPYIELFYKYTPTGFSLHDTHVHKGGAIEPPKVINSLDERNAKALENVKAYEEKWWVQEKRKRQKRESSP